jgi:hypothetical protein
MKCNEVMCVVLVVRVKPTVILVVIVAALHSLNDAAVLGITRE